MDPLVSIIMPVYNCDKYIDESIKSILKQTYKNFEIIVLDNNSTDNTLKIVREIKDDRIKVIQLGSNKGLNASFKEGLSRAKGEFIIRHDPDDISLPSRIERQVAYLQTHKELGMVSCLIKCFTYDADYINQCTFIEKIQNHYIDKESILNAIIGNFIPIIFPTLMIRKQLLNKIILSQLNQEFDDQIDLLLELIKIGGVEKVNKVLYSYRRHNEAYHIVNQRGYEEHTRIALENSDIKNYILYSKLYQNAKINKVNISLNQRSDIRILMLIDSLNIGGTETHVLNLVKSLINKGIYVVVGTSGGPLTRMFQDNGIKIVKVPIKGDYISNRHLFGLLNTVKQIIDTENINLIHSHLFGSMSIANQIYKKYNIPYIVTLHGLFYPKDILYSTCINASSIIAVSEPVKEMICGQLGKRVKDKVIVIPNGINIQEQMKDKKDNTIRKKLNIPDDGIIITYCSRLAWNKTIAAENFIFSCHNLALQYENLYAIVVGDGPDSNIIKREVDLINNSIGRDLVHLEGASFDVIQYYLESDIVVGTGRVALEAMSCCKPVISIGNEGYVGIVSEEMKELQWQTYFGDHDAIEKPDIITLGKAIKSLLDKPKDRKKIGLWSKKWCKEMFDEDLVTYRTIELYEEFIQKCN